jgi:hypothetical protein
MTVSGKRYLLCDRDPLFTKGFRDILASAGVEAVQLPPRSPNLNPHMERSVLSIRSESLDRLILFSEAQLRRAGDSWRIIILSARTKVSPIGSSTRAESPQTTMEWLYAMKGLVDYSSATTETLRELLDVPQGTPNDQRRKGRIPALSYMRMCFWCSWPSGLASGTIV